MLSLANQEEMVLVLLLQQSVSFFVKDDDTNASEREQSLPQPVIGERVEKVADSSIVFYLSLSGLISDIIPCATSFWKKK
mmetsp:Transcript_4480/g.8602  ORF Transcript_4480/g.8602 Transcript_4480/m.8602 type:complete len:80 (-) Transcript_4480:34-273(-)